MNEPITGRPFASSASSTKQPLAGEEDVNVAPKPRSCVPWPTLKLILASHCQRPDLWVYDDAVLKAQSGKFTLERPVAEHGNVEPALDDLGGADRLPRLGVRG